MSVDFTRLTLTEVTRDFGRRRALSRVSFTCKAGEILGLVGHNGAGKSTLLAILATLLNPSAGEIRYGELTAREAGPALRGRLGVLGHEVQLYAELTASENLRFFARLYGLSGPEARIQRALEHAGLAERASDPVASFSRGMRQRLALERALLPEPRLLLLDEPFTGLDELAVGTLIGRLQLLARDGCVIVMATHDLELAERVVTRALVLRNGRVASLLESGSGLRDAYRRAHAGSTS